MTKKFIVLAFLTLTLFACKKSGPDETVDPQLATGPETKPQYDNTAFGVYKGVVVGTTGDIKIVVNNGDNIVKAYIKCANGLMDTLTCTQPLINGQAISNARFTGQFTTFDFNVDADGSDPTISNMVITGQGTTESYVEHEKSTQQIKVYLGEYGGTEDGWFECIIYGTTMKAFVQCECGDWYSAQAVVTNNSFNVVFGSVSSGAVFQGAFQANSCNGEWDNPSQGDHGTFSGHRTI